MSDAAPAGQSVALPASIRETGVRDTRLVARAIKKCWPIPPEKRAALVNRQIEIATDEDVKPRESTAAFRSIISAEQQNIAAEQKPKRRPRPQPTTTVIIEQVIVPGDVEESRRRALEYARVLFAARDTRLAAETEP